MLPKPHLFAALFLASALLHAQRVYVVDQTGGLGTDFRDLISAVNGVRDGDVLRVRRGAYMLPPAILKGITILGENEPVLVGSGFNSFAALAYDKTLVVRRCRIAIGLSGLQVLGCQGRVHFDEVIIGSLAFDSLNIVDCRTVTLNRCTVVGQTAGAVAVGGSSNVLLSECTLTGHSMVSPLDAPIAAMTVRGGSLVLVSSCNVVGGSAYDVNHAPAPAIVLEDGRLEIAGNDVTNVAAGWAPIGAPGSPAIHTLGGSVLRDPRTRIRSTGPALPIDGPATVTSAPLASMLAAATGGGGSIQATLIGNPGDLAILLIGPATQPLPVSPFGNLMVDPTRLYFANVGVIAANGYVFQNFPVAGSATPGEAIAIQPLTGPGFDLRLHLPVVVTID